MPKYVSDDEDLIPDQLLDSDADAASDEAMQVSLVQLYVLWACIVFTLVMFILSCLAWRRYRSWIQKLKTDKPTPPQVQSKIKAA